MIRGLLRADTRSIARIAIVGGLMLRAMLGTGCSSGCGLGLTQRLSFSSAPVFPSVVPIPVPCCGEFLFHDVNLTAAEIKEVDLANTEVQTGHLDAFLTAPDCTKLFDHPYNGSVSEPLCKIYIGPVAAGTVSQRQAIPKGRYRVFAHAWASNDASSSFSVDVGLWTNRCRPSPTAPSQ